jgi:protein SCO1/2
VTTVQPRARRVARLPLFLFRALLALSLLVGLMPAPARAHEPDEGEHDHDPLPEILASAQFNQRLGEQVPLDLVFRDEAGQNVSLADLIGDKPVILTMNYYKCDSLCPLIMDGAATALKLVPFVMGQEFDMITVSINPDETPELAAQVKERLVERYEHDGAARNWHVLTGEKEMIDRLAEAVGFNYVWDEAGQQYAHPSGLMVLGPGGKVARYIYGMEFSPRDLRLALVEASDRQIASPVDHVLLFCYRYNPAVGKYSAIAFNTMRLGGAATILVLGLFLGSAIKRERKMTRLPGATG